MCILKFQILKLKCAVNKYKTLNSSHCIIDTTAGTMAMSDLQSFKYRCKYQVL